MKKKRKSKPPEPEYNPVKALLNKRMVCHQCGYEITNYPHHLIYDARYGVMTVCDRCWAAYVRRRDKNGRKEKAST